MRLKIQAPIALVPGLALIAGLSTISLILLWMWFRDHGIAEEDRLIEWAQAVCLGLASLVYGRRCRNMARESVPRIVFHGLALLTASFMIRELDIDSWGPPAIAETIQFGIRLALVIVWVLFARLLLRQVAMLWKVLRETLGTPVVVMAFIGCCLYLASWPFEKDLFALSPHASKFIGQLLQFHACALLLTSSLVRLAGGAAGGMPGVRSTKPLSIHQDAKHHCRL